jgi:hypothetical protein
MEPVRSGLRQIMADFLRKQPPHEAVLLAWPLVCGKEVAGRSSVLSFSEGKLLVEVPDATWRNQLQSFAGRYLSEYQHLLGPVVLRLEFKLKQAQHSAISTQHSAPKRPVAATKSAEGEKKRANRKGAKRNDI